MKPRPGATCPEELTTDAKAAWKRLEGELLRLGLLTALDRELLAAWCEAWANFTWASETIERVGRTTEAGNGTPIPHPAIQIQTRAAELMRKLAANFGFSPADRMRLLLEGAPDDDEEAKRLQRFFGPQPVPSPRRPT